MNYYSYTEVLSSEEIRSLQNERLVKQVEYVFQNVPYYRQKMNVKQLKPSDIRRVEDIHKLPFLSKQDLINASSRALFAKPLSECVRIHATSGTTGKEIIVCYSRKDIDLWNECCARAITAVGGEKEDIFHISYGYGLFTGGLGIQGGVDKIGALALPMSAGNTARQIRFMCDVGSTILCCTPSYASYLAENIQELGVQKQIKLRACILGGEIWTEEMRNNIEDKLGLKAYNIYGLTEICGPGVSFECITQNGMHINEDHFIPEIINPLTGAILPDKVVGELVLTCITKEAFPLLRYRTGDLCSLDRSLCSCGRTHVRMTRIVGRCDDMLTIRGVNIFPSQVETILLQEGFDANYQIEVDRINNNDVLDIYVEASSSVWGTSNANKNFKILNLVKKLKSTLGISPSVYLVAPKTFIRNGEKTKRVIDKRNLRGIQ